MENLKVDSAWHFSSSLYKNYFFGFSTCPISRPSISPFQPSLRGINELTRSSTRKELKFDNLGTTFIFRIGQKSRPCTPRKSMQDNGKRCTVTPLPPLFYSQGRFENFTSPFLQTHPSFLSFFPSSFSSRTKLSPHFSKKKRAGRPFVSFGWKRKKEKREKKKENVKLTHVHRTFHNYDGLALRNACWRVKKIWHVPFRTQRFGRNEHLCNKPSSSYLVRLEARGRGRGTLMPFIFARFPSPGI